MTNLIAHPQTPPPKSSISTYTESDSLAALILEKRRNPYNTSETIFGHDADWMIFGRGGCPPAPLRKRGHSAFNNFLVTAEPERKNRDRHERSEILFPVGIKKRVNKVDQNSDSNDQKPKLDESHSIPCLGTSCYFAHNLPLSLSLWKRDTNKVEDADSDDWELKSDKSHLGEGVGKKPELVSERNVNGFDGMDTVNN